MWPARPPLGVCGCVWGLAPGRERMQQSISLMISLDCVRRDRLVVQRSSLTILHFFEIVSSEPFTYALPCCPHECGTS